MLSRTGRGAAAAVVEVPVGAAVAAVDHLKAATVTVTITVMTTVTTTVAVMTTAMTTVAVTTTVEGTTAESHVGAADAEEVVHAIAAAGMSRA